MAKLTARQRRSLPRSAFALPGGRFPLTDPNHDRAALSGAPRAYHAGNITASQERTIISKARRLLQRGRARSHMTMSKYIRSGSDGKEDRFMSKLVGMKLSDFKRTPESRAIDRSVVRLMNRRA